MYEIAICINALCFDKKNNKFVFNKKKSKNLIKGYSKIRKFSDKEKKSLNVLCKGAALRYLLTRTYDYLNTPKRKIPKGSEVQIFTDSKYVKSGITEWIHNWKKNGWKTADKQPVKNKELWEELDLLNNEFEISWNWVKAHSTDELNNEVDLIAREAANL